MVCFINVLFVAVIFCSSVRYVEGNSAVVQSVDNAEQFALLCRIYNVAKNPPINHVDLQEPFKIVSEIDAINASFIEENQFNKTEKMGNSSYTHVKPTITREAAVAQAILRRINQKSHIILEKIRKLNVTRDFQKVKAEFSQVIFGEGKNESHLCDVVLKSMGDRGTACGKPGAGEKGSHAGKNLVVDFFCLCAMRKTDGIENVCGVYVGGTKDNYHGWDSNGPSGSSTMWASVKKGCGKLMHQHPISTEKGHEVLEDFVKHLETGGVYRWSDNSKVHGSNRKEGMLGTGMVKKGGDGADLLCDGKKGNGRSATPGGICVYYGNNDWDKKIDWLKQFKRALNTVDALNNKTATIQRDIEKLNMLLHRAEKIYETSRVISEVQNPVVQANFHTAAKRLTAYNAALRNQLHHFIATWVHFFL
ncbi:Variant surface glycoprotein [Trypanosoma congolense IL3000]|uniref:Variant surface glycoprotein n=1 Tax=Trypanosoma congolense (strain IL3000) TaxID=1068625 RepID=F9W4Q4_TRYCI|nr:Variant surface glycoprotein [Trypanosoma congolense IL3000]CCD14313.1 Variant surface glycoprotein [Trypanosoma congolense IL3000]